MDINCKINGVAATISNKYSIRQQAGAISSSTIDVRIPSVGSPPRTFERVEILDGTTPIFFGIIESVSSPSFSSGYEVKQYQLNVQSAEVVFNYRLVSESYEDATTTEIVNDLFTKYIEPEGFTLGTIDVEDITYTHYNCSYTKLSEVLNELSGDAGAVAHIKPDRSFNFVAGNRTTEIPAPTHIKELSVETENSDIRTVQILTGATEVTSLQVESCTWEEEQTTFTLAYNADSVVDATIDGSTVNVGIKGLDEDDVTKTFLYSKGSAVLSVNNSATVKPETGDSIEVRYYGYYDVIYKTKNDELVSEISAIAGTSGLIEIVHDDKTIDNADDARLKADTLLINNSKREQTVSCTCHEFEDTAIYTSWVIHRPDLGIDGRYTIIERTVEDFFETYLIKVRLSNKRMNARYGETLNRNEKNTRPDTKVYKQTALSDTIDVGDEYDIYHAGLTYWPTEGAYTDTMLPGFYPMGE